jgi:SnoaL-like domain
VQGRRTTGKRKEGDPLNSATQGDVGGFDEGRDAVAYLKPHVLHRACGNNGGHLADAGLHDDLTQHLVRDNLLHGAGYFVANHTPYVTYAGPSDKSIFVGWDALKTHWAEVNKRFAQRRVALTDQHIHVNGNLGWEMGQETGEGELKNGTPLKIDFIVTNVYEKLDGRWLMVSHHVQPKPQ